MAANHAVVVDHAVPGTLALREVASPTPLPSEALVRVAAISLNRGETRRAMEAADGWCPGWDLAGVVTQAAANGSGPRTGARVVGFLRSGAWAESVVVPTNALAALPDSVTFAQAATLLRWPDGPVCLTKRGLLLHRRVCITGATGGVGDFAIQLAHLAGAQVIAQVRRPDQVAVVKQIGADDVVIGEDQPPCPARPVRSGVGISWGKCLAAALATLAKDGVCLVGKFGVARSDLRYQTVSPDRSDDAVWLRPV